MKISQLKKILRDPIQEVMDRYGKGNIDVDFPSKMIGYSIYLLQKQVIIDQDVTDRNNPYGIIDPSSDTNQFMEFNSIVDATLYFRENCEFSEEYLNKYDSISGSNQLYRIDKEIMECQSGNIIDVPDKEPSVDQYTVTDKTGKEVVKTSDLKEAKQMAKLNVGSKIANSRGVVINAKQTGETEAIVKVDLKAGSKVICNGLNLYYNINDKAPGRSITGDYYLETGRAIKGRYAVCVKNGSDENPVFMRIGWINAKDVES